ncbi:hypothetical protein [Paracoccus sp. ME4]|uniref:hypothetical protein n=1 Tax=Paracoccus sp. ME4 TaxID=3138066 RepID=UPI00398AA4D7
MKTRDDARARFAMLGIAAADLDRGDIRRLENLLQEAMQDAEFAMRIDRRRTRVLDRADGRLISIRCRAEHFDDREAVTFNPDGFVGFAGWADALNIRPFLAGFSAWCDEMELQRQIAPEPEASPLP